MTVLTGHDLRIYAEMLGGKGPFRQFMTLLTELCCWFGKQYGLWGGMGQMTGAAISAGRKMCLLGLKLFFDFFMTDQTQIRAGGLQQRLQFCVMGVVTLGALPGGQRRMLAAGVTKCVLNIGMAAKTDIRLGSG